MNKQTGAWAVIKDRRGKTPKLVIVGEPIAMLLDQTTGQLAEIGPRPYSTDSVRRAALQLAHKCPNGASYTTDNGLQKPGTAL